MRGGKLILVKLPKPHELTPFQACVKLKFIEEFIEEPEHTKLAKDIMGEAAISCMNITPHKIMRWSNDLLSGLNQLEVKTSANLGLLNISRDIPDLRRREGFKVMTGRIAKILKGRSAIQSLKKQEWFTE